MKKQQRRTFKDSTKPSLQEQDSAGTDTVSLPTLTSNREILITNDIKHSIPLNEILSSGPAKDGISSIDNPKFIQAKQQQSQKTKQAKFA